MKTIKEFKDLLNVDNENTLLGMSLNDLFNEDHKKDATIHNLEEKIEVIAQMNKNGINVFTEYFKIGSVSKAFYQWKLNQYLNYK
jgi:hypothetical protein